MEEEKTSKLELTASIVCAYVAKNTVAVSALGELVANVYASLDKLGNPQVEEKSALVPAVPIKKSVTPEFIYSLEDGRKLKSLKRHLKSKYGLTPEQYRARWGLPPDYPMVAPNYAATRSSLARSMGLGRKGSDSAEAGAGDQSAAEAEAAPPARRTRRKIA